MKRHFLQPLLCQACLLCHIAWSSAGKEPVVLSLCLEL